MTRGELSLKEKLTLYGLIQYPHATDKQLSNTLFIKHSTITAIRHRLIENDLYRPLTIPRLQNLGCKNLAVIYTDFSPLIPLEERVKITGKTIEVFPEIFFSVGEQEKGFSLSLSEDYATIGRINDIRTETFGKRGLLEDEYPTMIVFPFEISRVYRFFDYAPLLSKHFDIRLPTDTTIVNYGQTSLRSPLLSETKKRVYCMLIKHPQSSDKEIGDKLAISRHTVSKARREFEEDVLIRKINLPHLKRLGFDILTLFHIRFDPRNYPDIQQDEAAILLSDSTILLVSRTFEAFMISIYKDYDEFSRDSTRIMQLLKEKQWISQTPMIRTHSLRELIYIKKFIFAPIAKKILSCDIQL